MGLGGRLLLLVLLTVIPLFGMVVLRSTIDREDARTAAAAETRRLASLAAASQDGLLGSARDALAALAATRDVARASGEECRTLLARLLPLYQGFGNLGVADLTGAVTCSALPTSGPVSIADRRYFKRAVEVRDFAIGEYQVGRIVGEPTINVGYPILDQGGSVQAVVFAAIRLSRLNEIAARSELPPGAAITLVDHGGTILARYPDPDAWVGMPFPEAPLVQAMQDVGEGTVETPGLDGVTRLYAFRPVGTWADDGLRLAVGFESASLYAAADRAFITSLMGLALALAIALLVAWLGSRVLVLEPVRVLLKATDRLAAGDLAARTGMAGTGGEIGRLARSFDAMAESVERRVEDRTTELSRALAELDDLYNRAPIGYHSLDADGVFLRVNDTELTWLGYEREELVGRMRAADLLTPVSVSVFQENFPQLVERGSVRDLEFDFVRKDGSILPAVVSATAIYDEAGRFLASRSTMDDITERRRARDALRRTEAELDRFFALSSDMFGVFGTDGTFHRVNAAWEPTLGYSPAELIGRPFIDLVHPDDVDRTIDEFRRATEEGTTTTRFENRYRHKDGSYRWLDWTGRLVPGEDVHYSAARDVTDRKQIEAALESARREAEAANRAKTEFLSRVSHELRTPLNAILGFAQLLGMDHLDGDQRESQEQILKAGRHLLDLINEVLDISRIETGQLPMSPEPVGVRDALEDALALIGPLAVERGIEISVAEIPSERHALADRQRLKQILLNLLSNAVKYNRPDGSVRVGCEPVGDERLRIAIVDEGPGINAEQRARLFAPFDRLGAEISGVEGTGLGLAFSRALAEQMGGQLGVDSVAGEGSTFWLDLPIATAAAPPAASSEPVSAAPAGGVPVGSVLCIEDNLSNLRLIERALASRANVHLLPAMLGRLGLDLASEHRPDLILLDLHLPDMPGDELLARLKADPATRDIPVVVLSADATPRQVERLLSQGARAYLTKPLDIPELLSLVDGLLGPDPAG